MFSHNKNSIVYNAIVPILCQTGKIEYVILYNRYKYDIKNLISSKSSMFCYYVNVLTVFIPILDDKISDFKKSEGKCPSYLQPDAYNSGMNSKLSSPCTYSAMPGSNCTLLVDRCALIADNILV